MRLRGNEYGLISGASGVQGFFGEGYRFHKPLRAIGLNFDGMTFTAKTMTLAANKGFMPLDHSFMPIERRPKCIVVKFKKGVVLNAVGLSNPGARALLETQHWQDRIEPFMLSFMSIAKSGPAERLEELKIFCKLLKEYRHRFNAAFALQLNYSCPNTDHDPKELEGEIMEGLTIAAMLDVPLLPKLNVMTSIDTALEIQNHRACEGICISNTIPWLELPKRIPWVELFGTTKSPLAYLGVNGGLSGKPLYPIVTEWVNSARQRGFKKAIIAGGGVLTPEEAINLLEHGADQIALGSMAILRPWRVQSTIRAVNNYRL